MRCLRSSENICPLYWLYRAHRDLIACFQTQSGMATAVLEFPRIKEVRAYVSTKAQSGDQGADCHDVKDSHWIDGHPVPIANPMSRYPLKKKIGHFLSKWL